MTSLEDAFRAVLAARLPKGRAWAAWIDGTVAELAAGVTVDEAPFRDALDRANATNAELEIKFAQVRALCDRADREYESYQFERIGDEIRAILAGVS